VVWRTVIPEKNWWCTSVGAGKMLRLPDGTEDNPLRSGKQETPVSALYVRRVSTLNYDTRSPSDPGAHRHLGNGEAIGGAKCHGLGRQIRLRCKRDNRWPSP
jgi:hypothetical protein